MGALVGNVINLRKYVFRTMITTAGFGGMM